MGIAAKNGLEGSFEELCMNPKMNQIILKSMQTHGKAEGLYGFEQPQKIYLEPISFVTQNITTPTSKVIRHLAAKKYASIIKELYKDPII